MFGTPGIMERAAMGEFGFNVCPEYGLFPRGIIDIFNKLQIMETSNMSYVLTASAVEISLLGNVDMMVKSGVGVHTKFANMWSGALGVALAKSAKPPKLYGMVELEIKGPNDLLVVFAAVASRNTVGTKLNDSSSRSHAFVFLTLYAHNRVSVSMYPAPRPRFSSSPYPARMLLPSTGDEQLQEHADISSAVSRHARMIRLTTPFGLLVSSS